MNSQPAPTSPQTGSWTLLTGPLHDLSVRLLAPPRRTEVEKGPILWVEAYLRSESARSAPMEKAMLRPGVEPEADEKRCW